jgi:hypothetical protein
VLLFFWHAQLNWTPIARADAMDSAWRTMLDLGSTEILVHGVLAYSAYNGHHVEGPIFDKQVYTPMHREVGISHLVPCSVPTKSTPWWAGARLGASAERTTSASSAMWL